MFWRLKKAFVLDDNAKSFLAEQGYVIPYFTQNDLQSEDFEEESYKVIIKSMLVNTTSCTNFI